MNLAPQSPPRNLQQLAASLANVGPRSPSFGWWKSKGWPFPAKIHEFAKIHTSPCTDLSVNMFLFFIAAPQGNESVLLSTVEHVVEKAVSAATSNLGQLIEEKMATQAGGGGGVFINVGPVTSYQYRAVTRLYNGL